MIQICHFTFPFLKSKSSTLPFVHFQCSDYLSSLALANAEKEMKMRRENKENRSSCFFHENESALLNRIGYVSTRDHEQKMRNAG